MRARDSSGMAAVGDRAVGFGMAIAGISQQLCAEAAMKWIARPPESIYRWRGRPKNIRSG